MCAYAVLALAGMALSVKVYATYVYDTTHLLYVCKDPYLGWRGRQMCIIVLTI